MLLVRGSVQLWLRTVLFVSCFTWFTQNDVDEENLEIVQSFGTSMLLVRGSVQLWLRTVLFVSCFTWFTQNDVDEENLEIKQSFGTSHWFRSMSTLDFGWQNLTSLSDNPQFRTSSAAVWSVLYDVNIDLIQHLCYLVMLYVSLYVSYLSWYTQLSDSYCIPCSRGAGDQILFVQVVKTIIILSSCVSMSEVSCPNFTLTRAKEFLLQVWRGIPLWLRVSLSLWHGSLHLETAKFPLLSFSTSLVPISETLVLNHYCTHVLLFVVKWKTNNKL